MSTPGLGKLPFASLQECSLHFSHQRPDSSIPAGFPQALLSCTKLTDLQITANRRHSVPNWGGLPPRIVALLHPARLRLQNCLTKPLTESASALLSRISSLALRDVTRIIDFRGLGFQTFNEVHEHAVARPHQLPGSIAQMAALRCLDGTHDAISGPHRTQSLVALSGEQTHWPIRHGVADYPLLEAPIQAASCMRQAFAV